MGADNQIKGELHAIHDADDSRRLSPPAALKKRFCRMLPRLVSWKTGAEFQRI